MKCPATSSGLLTADTAVTARPARLHSVQVLADATNAATVVIYDNASAASGTAICKVIVKATDTYASFLSMEGVVCNNGIYVDVSGTGAAFIVHYNEE